MTFVTLDVYSVLTHQSCVGISVKANPHHCWRVSYSMYSVESPTLSTLRCSIPNDLVSNSDDDETVIKVTFDTLEKSLTLNIGRPT